MEANELPAVCRAIGDTRPTGPVISCDALIQAAATLVGALAAIGAVLWAFLLEERRARALRHREVSTFVRKIEGLLERMPREDREDTLKVFGADLQDLERAIAIAGVDQQWAHKLPVPPDVAGTAAYLVQSGDRLNLRFEQWERDRVTPEVVALCEVPDQKLEAVQRKLFQLRDEWHSLPSGSTQAEQDERVFELLRIPYREVPLAVWNDERARMRAIEMTLLGNGAWTRRAILILRIVADILNLRRDLVLAYTRVIELHVGDLPREMDLARLDDRLKSLARWRVTAKEIDRLYPRFRTSLLYEALRLDLPRDKAEELL